MAFRELCSVLTGKEISGPVTIYASTDLVEGVGICTLSMEAGTFDFTDSAATNHAVCFSKAVGGP